MTARRVKPRLAFAVGHAAGSGIATARGNLIAEAVGSASGTPVKQYPMLPPRPTRSGEQQAVWDALAKRYPDGPIPPTSRLLRPLSDALGYEVGRDTINRVLKRRTD